ncbi:hypothetical protein K492DRAFT_199971 [Lichtheimia hyalospora FSU 10163]|nr:hypothetical protein K492DRAFT_199971 [Lichtheimia hyalospora FSU 10163]
MRFFTSISIAALCFVAIIQAAPSHGHKGKGKGQVAGDLPAPANKVGDVLRGKPDPNAAQANGYRKRSKSGSPHSTPELKACWVMIFQSFFNGSYAVKEDPQALGMNALGGSGSIYGENDSTLSNNDASNGTNRGGLAGLAKAAVKGIIGLTGQIHPQ